MHDPEYSESRISILCKDEKQLLKAKACTTDRSFSGATPSSAIQTILSDWNSAYGEDFSGFVATSVKTITKDAQKGDDIFTWIDTVCEIA